MSTQPSPWTRTVIKLNKSNEVRHLFRSPEGKLIFDQPLVGKIFTIVNDRLPVDGASQPDPSALKTAQGFVQVQVDPNLYLVTYLRSDGSPQLPSDPRVSWHALQKPNGDWCFVDRTRTTVPEDWSAADRHKEAPTPAAETSAESKQPEQPKEPEKRKESEKTEEPEKPKEAKQSKQAEETNANYGNSGDNGNGACTEASRSGNSENSPITNLSRSAGVSEACHPRGERSEPKDRRRNPERSEGSPPPNYPILEDLEKLISNYLVCSKAQRTVLALWILHTYAHYATPLTPYLNIYSPMEESGKSTCMTILRALCADPWWAGGSTPAFFKRKLISKETTVLLDNWHTLFRASDKHAMSGFLLNGCNLVPEICARAEHAQNHSVEHCRYSPKAFAGMESLPPALARRSIPIVLQRRRPQEKVKSSLWIMYPPATEKLIAAMKAWAKDHDDVITKYHESYQNQTVPGLAPHQQESFKVLLAVAAAAGGDWLLKGYEALRKVFDDYNEGQASPTQLLSDIRDIFARRGNQERLFTAELLEELHDRDDRIYHEWTKKGDPMNAHALSAILRKHFGVYSRSQRRGEKKLRGYQLSDFQKAWNLYLPPPDEACHAERKTCHSEVTATRKTCHSEVSAKRVAEEPAPLHSRQNEDAMVSAPQSARSESTPSTMSTQLTKSAAEELRQKKITSKPRKPGLVSMSQSKASTEKTRPKATSRLRHFAAKTLRIFTAIWS